MSLLSRSVFCLLLLLAPTFTVSSGEPAPALESVAAADAIQAVAEQVRPSLVRIHVVSTTYSGGRELKFESSGSGVIIRDDGYLISNHHVAGHAIRMFCTLHDNERYEAELIGTDPLTDVAVLRLLAPEGVTFQAAVFGDSDDIQVGDPVLAMGSPLALSQSVTKGIVSNTRMVMPGMFSPFSRFELDGENVGSIVRWIGHDAAIYGGNSGGALVNLRGEVIGINEIQFGLGGAIPANLARQIAVQLIDDGRVERSWLGLEVQPLLLHGEESEGVLVAGALPGSPAEEAGFESGDLLLAIDGVPLTVRHAEEMPIFNQFIADLPRGAAVAARVRRGEEEHDLELVPVAWEEARPRTFEFREWGMTGRDISRTYALEKQLPDRNGLLVTSIRPGGPCGEAKPMIHVGAIITQVGDTPVTGIDDFRAATASIVADEDHPVPTLVSFRSGRDELSTVVRVGIQPQEDPAREAMRAHLAVSSQVITRELAPYFGDVALTGVRVTRVHPNSNAEEAGLAVGDLILAVDGEPVRASRPEDHEVFSALIRQYRIGSEVELTTRRGDETLSRIATLVRAPPPSRELRRYTDNRFDFSVRDLSESDRLSPELETAEAGVLVVSVQQGGWAALGNLAGGDLILEVNGEPVADVAEFEGIMNRLPNERPQAVVLQVRRGVRTYFLELEPDWDGVGRPSDRTLRSDV